MTKKIIPPTLPRIIEFCGDCPYRRRLAGAITFYCTQTQYAVAEIQAIPEWCPLENAMMNNQTTLDYKERYRRACVLLQLMMSDDYETMCDAAAEAREQLKEWGVKLPETHDDEYEDIMGEMIP